MGNIFNANNNFFRFMALLVDLFLINLLFIIFSIPLLTIGSSLTAMYTLTLRIIRKENHGIIKPFLKAFKDNFKESTLIWIVMITVGLILYSNISFISYLSGIYYVVLFFFILFAVFVFGSTSTLIFFTLARYNNTIIKIAINSLKMLVMNPHILILLWIITYVPFLLIVVSPIVGISFLYIFTFGGFALFALIKSYLAQLIFNKYE